MASSPADVYHRRLKPESAKPTDDWHALQRVEVYRPSNSTDRVTDLNIEEFGEAFSEAGGIKATTDIHLSVSDQRRPNLVEYKHAASMFPAHDVSNRG